MRIYTIGAIKLRAVALSRVATGTAFLLTAVLGGCADSLPVSALPSRDQTAQPALDKAAQQKAMDDLIRERDERQARITQPETAPAARR